MKYLLEMIEQVKKQGKIEVLAGDELDPVTKLSSITDAKAYKPELFYHHIEHCQPFVFSPTKETTALPGEVYPESKLEAMKNFFTGESSGEIIAKEFVSPDVEEILEFDAPFKIWSAEIAGRNNYITVSQDPFAPVQVSIISFVAVEQENIWHGDEKIKLGVGETYWTYFLYMEVTSNGRSFKTVVLNTSTSTDRIAKAMVDRMNSNKEIIGTESVNHKVKIGSGKSKRFHRFKKVVHIRPKKYKTSEGEGGRTIEWTHRWWTRGHWRDIAGVGKDRLGNYTQSNRTWVVEHVKGPESAPLIQKTRIVHSENNSPS